MAKAKRESMGRHRFTYSINTSFTDPYLGDVSKYLPSFTRPIPSRHAPNPSDTAQYRYAPPQPTPTIPSTPFPTSPTSPIRTPTPTRKISIISPNGGETFIVGQIAHITWSSTLVDQVLIGYTMGPGSFNYITPRSINNTNSYDWTVNVGNTTNTQFKIDITGYQTGVGSTTDQSDGFFTVHMPSPTSTPAPPSPTPTVIILPTYTPIPTKTPTPLPLCNIADLDKDGVVNEFDDTIFVADLLKPSLSNPRSDMNNNGIVDVSDYGILVQNYLASTGPCQ